MRRAGEIENKAFSYRMRQRYYGLLTTYLNNAPNKIIHKDEEGGTC